jgi:hypothetical protein
MAKKKLKGIKRFSYTAAKKVGKKMPSFGFGKKAF